MARVSLPSNRQDPPTYTGHYRRIDLGTDQTATVTRFDEDSEEIVEAGRVQYWAVWADVSALDAAIEAAVAAELNRPVINDAAYQKSLGA